MWESSVDRARWPGFNSVPPARRKAPGTEGSQWIVTPMGDNKEHEVDVGVELRAGVDPKGPSEWLSGLLWDTVGGLYFSRWVPLARDLGRCPRPSWEGATVKMKLTW